MQTASPKQLSYIVALRAELGLRPLEWNEVTTLTVRQAHIMIGDMLQIKKILKSEVITHA